MQIASFSLPTRDACGHSLAALHADVQAALAEAFGSFTARETADAWTDAATGAEVAESAIRYEVAADFAKLDKRGHPRTLNRFFNLCGVFAGRAGSLAISATGPDGETYLVTPGATQAPREAAPRPTQDGPISWRALNERLAEAA